jgi:predicted GIY-YIG superfamily endonuclease
MQFWVYILRNVRRLNHTGHTGNLEKRLWDMATARLRGGRAGGCR